MSGQSCWGSSLTPTYVSYGVIMNTIMEDIKKLSIIFQGAYPIPDGITQIEICW